MTQSPHLDPAPFLLQGGDVGVLLIHGFTGSPPEMQLIARALHEQGCTVTVPLLPGHGTLPEALNKCTWLDWAGHVEKALATLRSNSDTLYVGGLSMGALLALYLAAQDLDIAGAILYAPALRVRNRALHLVPLAKHLVSTLPKEETDLVDAEALDLIWSYPVYPLAAVHQLLKLLQHVRSCLSQITCPTLIVHSTGDRSIHPQSAQLIYDSIRSPHKELLTLHRSGHCLTVDQEWREVAETTVRFIHQHSTTGASTYDHGESLPSSWSAPPLETK